MKSNGKLGKLDATSRGESAKDNSLTQKSFLVVRPDVKKMGGGRNHLFLSLPDS